MTQSIKECQKNLISSMPKKISIVENSKTTYTATNKVDTVIVAAKHALGEYLNHSVYLCQPNRSFRPVGYLGFYSEGKIDKHITKILGQVDKVLLTEKGITSGNFDKKTEERLLELINSLERKDVRGRIGLEQKVFFLSSPDSYKTLTLKKDIQNDTKSITGKFVAFTQNQRYVSTFNLKKNPQMTSEIV